MRFRPSLLVLPLLLLLGTPVRGADRPLLPIVVSLPGLR
jgi:hypothetical protein